jgi:zinc transport system substrate-binding protein
MFGNTKGVSFIVILAVFVIIIAVLGAGLNFWKSKKDDTKTFQDDRITVVTTIFPYYDMARTLAEKDAVVYSLLPPGVSPHHYEPRPSDIRLLSGADVFIYSGPLLEPWAENLLGNVKNPDLVVVNASEHALILLMVGEEHPGLAQRGQHEIPDPHIWLDFDNAISILKATRDAFIEADPSLSGVYEDRALIYESDLKSLDSKYRNTFNLCRTRTFVHGGHRSFGYIAQRYNLDYFATMGVDDSEEVTANELAGLITLIKEKALPYVFYESFDSPRTAEVLAKESGSGILTLNPAANVIKQDFDEGTTFFDIMESNLRNLSLALECQ